MDGRSIEMQALAQLLTQRNRLDDEMARLIGRPALDGHLGEFIASRVFDIELEKSATTPGLDGRFRSGALKGRAVNVKLYRKREGMLDIPAQRPNYFLVMTGPRSPAVSSSNTTRPLVIDEVFLFEREALISDLEKRGVKIGVATSMKNQAWDAARIWPNPPATSLLPLTADQSDMLSLFTSVRVVTSATAR